MSDTSNAIRDTLTSPNVADANLEPANVVDVIHELARTTKAVASAITADAAAGKDVHGGTVASLTEAVMGLSKSIQNVADAIYSVGEVLDR